MDLGLNDLHPAVADVLKARVWLLRFNKHGRAEDAGARRVLAKRWKGWGWRVAAAAPVCGAAGAAIAAALGATGGDLGAATFMAAYFGTIATAVATVVAGGLARHRRVSGEEVRALGTGVDFGPSEKVYLDTVCALLDAGGNVSDQIGRDILSTVNDLLEQARYVATRLERLRQAASTDSVADLERERERLAARIEAASDPQARADLQQGLTMCDDRLTNARALAPLIERMDAQREVIHQTLLSVQSAISRLQVAPSAITAPDIEEVRRVVGDVTTQTRAVEDAVEQVMALRA